MMGIEIRAYFIQQNASRYSSANTDGVSLAPLRWRFSDLGEILYKAAIKSCVTKETLRSP